MLNKAIIHGKEHRKPYRKAKAFDTSCRNHGSCDYCKSNRMHSFDVERIKAEDKVRDYLKFNDEDSY